jgi:hypothetical protein
VVHDDAKPGAVDLRPVIARLKEIERKCESMGSRNEEFPLMRDRLRSIIARLEAGDGPSDQTIDYRAMARELFPVAHLFESVGFLSVGKEIAHVERSLQELASEVQPAGTLPPPSTVARSATARRSPGPSPPTNGDGSPATGKTEGTEDDRPHGVPVPIIFGLAVLVMAVVIAAAIIFQIGPFAPDVVPPTPVPTPWVVPTPTAVPTAMVVRSDPDAALSSSERIANALAGARHSLEEDDFDAAVAQLSAASLIDSDDTTVVGFAQELVDYLVNRATVAAMADRWDDATELTARARRFAIRFGLDTNRIDAAEVHYADMQRFKIIDPENTAEIRASVGKLVEIYLVDHSQRRGRIVGIEGAALVFQVEDDVGGGVVRFSDKLPLSDIQRIKVWED